MSGWLNDESTYDHVATPTAVATGAAPTYSTSIKKFGSSSAKFVRTSDVAGGYLNIPDSDAFMFTMTWSINFWIYPIWNNYYMGLFGDWIGGSTDYGWKFYFHEDDARIRSTWSWGNDAHSWTFSTGVGQYLIPNDTWTHIAISRDASAQRYRIWKNGVLATIKDFTSGRGGLERNSSRDFYIGAQDDLVGGNGPKFFFNGYIDALHIEDGVSNWSGADGTIGTKYFSPENYTVGPTATAYSTLLMNFDETLYEVAGDLSHDSRIIVIDEDTRTVEYDATVSGGGSYSVTVNDTDLKTVTAVRESDGEGITYGRVVPSLQV